MGNSKEILLGEMGSIIQRLSTSFRQQGIHEGVSPPGPAFRDEGLIRKLFRPRSLESRRFVVVVHCRLRNHASAAAAGAVVVLVGVRTGVVLAHSSYRHF